MTGNKANDNQALDYRRDSSGRFVDGTRGGPGNPLVKNVQQARRAILDATTPHDIEQITRELLAIAFDRDGCKTRDRLAAIKLILQYTCGPPPKAVPETGSENQGLQHPFVFHVAAGQLPMSNQGG